MVQRPAALARCAVGVTSIDRKAFEQAGFARAGDVLSEAALTELAPLFDRLGSAKAGHRLPPAALAGLLSIDTLTALLTPLFGAEPRPVRALLFDKHAENNWALGWHQDRTIELAARIDTPGFGPWTIKAGRHHVAPPIALLEAMITVRLHLDSVDSQNAPLLVAPGSHRLGRILEPDISATVARCGTVCCLAERGSVWVHSTPILHASDPAENPRHRRVVQIDFAALDLPNGLHWADAE